MSLFAWANSKLEQLSEQLAPVPNDPGHRFSKACSSNDPHLALQLLSSTPPPLPDGSQCSPVDPFTTVINKQKGTLSIHCAAEFAQINVVQSLIAHFGVSAEQFDHHGNTPLHYAASSRLPAVLNLVKSLVNEYNVSVTIKNMHGQTAYDVATQDSIRQFLLPIQLQRETQECIDNGGKGLPDGIDLGGMAIKRDIAPPPIVGGFGLPPMGGGGAGAGGGGATNHNYSAAALGTSKYAVPMFGQQPPQQPAAMGSYASPVPGVYGAPHGQKQYPSQQLQPQSILNMGVNAPGANVAVQPTPVAMPNNGNLVTLVDPAPVQTPDAAVSEPAGAPVVAEQASQAVDGTAKSGALAASSELIPGEKPTETSVAALNQTGQPTSDTYIPVTATPAMEVISAQPANRTPAPVFSYGSNVAAPSLYGATPAPFTSPVATAAPVQTTEVAVSAPTSGSSYARRGFSTAAVLPKNSKYKPDGFHSSSSDTSLQKKYGHDSSITGPPSGTYSNSNIAPPPTAATGAGAGYNPYASSTTFGVPTSMARPRYPTYDAVSDTVGAAAAAGGGTGYNYNPYGADTMQAQYNVYNPQQHQQYQQPAYDYSQQQQVTAACPWKAATAPDGRTYYYNEVTSETTWDMPAELQYLQTVMHQQQYQQTSLASQNPADVLQPVAQVNDVINATQEQAPAVLNQTVTATQEPQPITQSAEMGSTLQEPSTVSQESAPVESLTPPVDQNAETPTAQHTQNFFDSSSPLPTAQQTVNPDAVISDQLQTMNVGSPARQTSTASATELFGSPVMQSSISHDPMEQSAEVFSPIPALDVQPEVKQTDEDADDSDDSLSPPPIATEEPSAAVESLPVEAQDDDLFPLPPFGGDSNDNDASGDDDLPPPPMMDVNLSE